MASAGILPSYRCEARTGRKKLVGMQPGGNILLLPAPKRAHPILYSLLVCAEEDPRVQPSSLCLEPGFKSFLSLVPTTSRRAEAHNGESSSFQHLLGWLVSRVGLWKKFREQRKKQSCCTSLAVQLQGCCVS